MIFASPVRRLFSPKPCPFARIAEQPIGGHQASTLHCNSSDDAQPIVPCKDAHADFLGGYVSDSIPYNPPHAGFAAFMQLQCALPGPRFSLTGKVFWIPGSVIARVGFIAMTLASVFEVSSTCAPLFQVTSSCPLRKTFLLKQGLYFITLQSARSRTVWTILYIPQSDDVSLIIG